VIHKWTRI